MDHSTAVPQLSDVQQILMEIQDGPIVGCGGGCMHGQGMPVGRLANDVAELYQQRKDEETENALVTLLENEHDIARFVAYCVLRQNQENVSPDAFLKLEEFVGKPENADIIRSAAEQFGV